MTTAMQVNEYSPPPRPPEKLGGYKTEGEDRIGIWERLALRSKVEAGKHLDIYGG